MKRMISTAGFHLMNNTHFLDTSFSHIDGSACCSSIVNTAAASSLTDCENRCLTPDAICEAFVFQPSSGACWIGKASSHGIIPVPSADRIAGLSSSVKIAPTIQLDMPQLLNSTFPYGTGILLGVGAGRFAKLLLNNWAGGLYLVDPYIHIWRGYDDPSNVDDKTHQLLYEELRRELLPFASRHVFIRDFSLSVSELWREKALSLPIFVYLDNNHTESAIIAELDAWWGLVVGGGFLSGSLYNLSSVRSAVGRFFESRNVTVHVIGDFEPDWIVFKPLFDLSNEIIH